MTFPAPYERCKQHALASGECAAYHIHNLIIRVADHLFSGNGGICRGYAGEKKSQKIRYLRYCAYGGPRVVARGLLLYGDDWTQPFNALYVRLLQDSHKMPCIGRQGVDISPLAFCIYGIECERRFPASAQTGNNHQFAAWNIYIYIFEVVRVRSPYLYKIITSHCYGKDT